MNTNKIICIKGLLNFVCEFHRIEIQKNKLTHLSILHVGIVHAPSSKEHSRCKNLIQCTPREERLWISGIALCLVIQNEKKNVS